MKRPLNEEEMSELLELARNAAQKATETGDFVTEIALKYQKKMQQVRDQTIKNIG